MTRALHQRELRRDLRAPELVVRHGGELDQWCEGPVVLQIVAAEYEQARDLFRRQPLRFGYDVRRDFVVLGVRTEQIPGGDFLHHVDGGVYLAGQGRVNIRRFYAIQCYEDCAWLTAPTERGVRWKLKTHKPGPRPAESVWTLDDEEAVSGGI